MLEERVLELPSGVAPALGRAVLVHPPAHGKPDAGTDRNADVCADDVSPDKLANDVAVADAGSYSLQLMPSRPMGS